LVGVGPTRFAGLSTGGFSARTTEPNVHVSMHPALLGFVLLGYAAVPSELLVQGVAIQLPRYR
jgi:hypothetical protein